MPLAPVGNSLTWGWLRASKWRHTSCGSASKWRQAPYPSDQLVKEIIHPLLTRIRFVEKPHPRVGRVEKFYATAWAR